jgi:hypothetical protein
MKMATRATLILLLGSLIIAEGPGAVGRSDAGEAGRIAFNVTAIEVGGGKQELLSESLIEGPAGTDFTIKLNSGRFSMEARFLTDLMEDGSLKVRASLNTRRLLGKSERDLPLYEEDVQQQTMSLGFDEQIVLLPFGRQSEEEQLRVQIVPVRSRTTTVLPSGKRRPLEITILKQAPGGQINIFASKIPHRFEVEAVLLEDGKPVAQTKVPALLKEKSELLLDVSGPGSSIRLPIRVSLTLDGYIRSRPADSATINFNVDKLGPGGDEAVARNWAGVCDIGSPLTYELTRHYGGEPGRKYELQFNLKLAPGESDQ